MGGSSQRERRKPGLGFSSVLSLLRNALPKRRLRRDKLGEFCISKVVVKGPSSLSIRAGQLLESSIVSTSGWKGSHGKECTKVTSKKRYKGETGGVGGGGRRGERSAPRLLANIVSVGCNLE